ncbi:unnamed protein product [Rangifer tarandus platyrhynchus]|uniref:Uncharacterized protein n=1 Tax=Rangifer tarandus platyrhynchus TaxID=3082113 RepID=A0AC59YRL0_RANTA
MSKTPVLRPLQRRETGLPLTHPSFSSELLHPRRCGPHEQVPGVQGGRGAIGPRISITCTEGMMAAIVLARPLSGVVVNTCLALEDKDDDEEEVESLAFG